jgi:serine/threonine protein kinase
LVGRGDYDVPDHLSRDAKDLLKKLLEVAPEKRLSISEIRAHPFCSSRAQPITKGLLPNEKIYTDLDIVQ